MQGGLYVIQNNINGKFYVGSTAHFDRRFILHRCLLRKGTHHSKHLQNAWNKYGEDAFSFMRLQYIEGKELRLRYEQAFLDGLKPAYNSAPIAQSCEGVVRSEQTRAKMRAAMATSPRRIAFVAMARAPRSVQHRANIAASKMGQRPSEETRAKLRAASRRRWSKK